jgi:hypothetical protein
MSAARSAFRDAIRRSHVHRTTEMDPRIRTYSIAEANAKAIRQVAEAISKPGGMNAVNLTVAEQSVTSSANLAQAGGEHLLGPAHF